MKIHPTAVIHPKAVLADDVEVGAYSVIGEHVRIGAGTRVLSHVSIDGWTEIGERCELHPFVSVGAAAAHAVQGRADESHHRSRQHPARVCDGQSGDRAGGGVTSLGNANFLMAYVHVAHDCHLGNQLILANAASLAGHITIGDHAIIGGLSGIHQFVRIGAYAMVGGCCALGQDLPPFMRAAGGYRARMYGLNSIGLRRHGFSADRISLLKQAYELLFRSGHRVGAAAKLARDTFANSRDVMQVVDFMEGTKRGICRSVGKEQEGDEE